MKKWLLHIVAIVFILAQLPITASASETKFNVLALGDSLASGVTPNNEIDKGYADYLALLLEENGRLESFNKGFAYPGYKTTDVLKDLNEDVVKSAINYDIKLTQDQIKLDLSEIDYAYGEEKAISEAIASADIITLSIGANDLLASVPRTASGTVDISKVNVATITNEIQLIAQNITEIFNEIYAINEDVQIVFMGYYNPFPYDTANKFMLNLLVSKFDDAVKTVVENNGGSFIDVDAEIAKNYLTYLPNPQNIHLSTEGYQYVAQKMFEALNLHSTQPVEVIVPTDVENHWGKQYIVAAMEQGIFNGYGDNTFKPNQTLSRLEMTSIIKRTFNLPDSKVTLPFTDLTNAYAPMVEELRSIYEAKIALGDGTGKFNSNDPITREQIAQMILRTYEHQTKRVFTPTVAVPYKDIANVSDEAKRAIAFLYENKIVEPAENYNPKNGLTRAEAAKILVSLKNI